MPKAISGNFASVFTIQGTDGRRWAVKCFTRYVGDQAVRYRQVSEALQKISSPWKVPFEYLPRGVLCQGTWYPALKMEWVEATGLLPYIDAHLSDQQALAELAKKFGYLVQELSRYGIAHGDLQHGNILVTPSGGLKLIDYDGMYVPGLAGLGASELGHVNYQSPLRTAANWGPDLDQFSSWVIYASLTALALDPTLWHVLHADGDEALLFHKSDFADRDQSRVRYALMNSSAIKLREIARDIDFLWEQDLSAVPPLKTILVPGDNAARVEMGTDWLRQMGPMSALPNGTTAVAGTPGAAGRAGTIGTATWLTTHLPVAPYADFTRPVGVTRVICAVLVSLMVLLTVLATVATPAFVFFDVVLLLIIWIISFISYASSPVRQERRRSHKAFHLRQHAAVKANRALSDLEHAAAGLDRAADSSKSSAGKRAGSARADEQREIAAVSKRLEKEIGKRDREVAALQGRARGEAESAVRALQRAHIDGYLRAARVSTAKISGIGSGLVSSLAASGIANAADFTGIRFTQNSYGRRGVNIVLRSGMQVSPRGIGEKKAQALDAWRRGVAFQAQRTQPGALPQAQADAIADKYAQQTRSIAVAQQAARVRAVAEQETLHKKWAQVQVDIANELTDAAARFAGLRAEKEAELATARQQSGTADWKRDYAKREQDRYRRISYQRYLWRMVTG